MFLIQQKQRVAMVETLAKDFTHLAAQLKSSEEHISLSLQNVSAVIMSMQIITMNARIEAARAGEMGKASEVVVEAMQGTMGNIKKALEDIRIQADCGGFAADGTATQGGPVRGQIGISS